MKILRLTQFILKLQKIKLTKIKMADLEHQHNNSLNNSTSKQQYTFSKVSRFRERMKTQGTDRYYQIPTTRSKMTFSFGKMVRCQLNRFAKGNQSPPPGSYDVEGEVDKILKKKQGVKLMYGREQCKSGSIFKVSDTPGPGSYEPNPEFTQSKLSRNLTLGKPHTTKRLVTEEPLPGPGAYPMPSLILNENKVLSIDSKRCVGKLFYSDSKSSRIRRVETEASPQMRLPEINFKGEKTFRNDRGYSLSRSSRFNIKKLSDVPGPGTYAKFSEFISNLKK